MQSIGAAELSCNRVVSAKVLGALSVVIVIVRVIVIVIATSSIY